MKNLNFFALGLILFCNALQAQTYQNSTATAPVDGIARLIHPCGYVQPGVHMSVINIPITGTIVDPSKITFNLSLNANWLGEVAADIVRPSGEAMTLIRRIGTTPTEYCGDDSNFASANLLSFNSANVNPIDAASLTNEQSVPPGNYIPTLGTSQYPTHNPISMASFLNGMQVNGDWFLVIYDYGAGLPSNIASWQINIAAGALLRSNETGVFTSEIIVKENPVKDQLLLKLNNNDFKSLVLEVYDASGKIMKKENILKQATDFEIDASTWSQGLYMLIPIKDGERKQPIKLIKK